MNNKRLSITTLLSGITVSLLASNIVFAETFKCPPPSSIHLAGISHGINVTYENRRWTGWATMPLSWALGAWQHVIKNTYYYLSKPNELHCNYENLDLGILVQMHHRADAKKSYSVHSGLSDSVVSVCIAHENRLSTTALTGCLFKTEESHIKLPS